MTCPILFKDSLKRVVIVSLISLAFSSLNKHNQTFIRDHIPSIILISPLLVQVALKLGCPKGTALHGCVGREQPSEVGHFLIAVNRQSRCPTSSSTNGAEMSQGKDRVWKASVSVLLMNTSCYSSLQYKINIYSCLCHRGFSTYELSPAI